MRSVLLLATIIGGLLVHSEAFAEWCSLPTPSVVTSGTKSKIVVRIDCSHDQNDAVQVAYPDKTLYVAVTLIAAKQKYNQQIITIGDLHGNVYLDLKPVTIPFMAGRDRNAAEFFVGDISRYTHLLVGVWNTKEPCDAESVPPDEPGNGCRLYKFALGPVDDDGYPAPTDAWPRPKCDVRYLKQIGFFMSGKDPSMLPKKWKGAALLNDCWNLVKGNGLGYSLHTWKAAPIPTLEQGQ
jgi:hypothetical protein